VYIYQNSQVVAICSSPSTLTVGLNDWRKGVQIPINGIANGNPTVITSNGHGLDTSLALNNSPPTARPSISIVGATGAWLTLDATWTASVLTPNTFSIPLDSTGFGAYTQTGPYFTTTAPRAGQAEWAVQRLFYDASGNAVAKLWVGGVQTYTNRCNDAISTTVQVQ
jgi:hypothetical protein